MMSEQIVILFFLLLTTGLTMYLYLWKAKKEIEYRKDERWQFIQNKANNTANYSNSILVLVLAIGSVVSVFYDIKVTFTFDRVLLFGILFFGFRNGIEVFALRYFDKRL